MNASTRLRTPGRSKSLTFSSVGKKPGANELTVMPRLAHSIANWRVSIVIAPFDAAYGARPGVELATAPKIDPTLTMRPGSFRAKQRVANSWQRRNAALRLTSSMRDQPPRGALFA